jgi:signal transduction histidine kinase
MDCMLSLAVVRGPDRGRVYPLPEREPQLIGRSTEALDLTDASISRRHAELTPDVDGWRVRDLGSRHGTFVNGARTDGLVRVGAGDRIRCGDSEFLLVSEGAAPIETRDDGMASDAASRAGGSPPADLTSLLVARALEPTDADAFLAEAARAIAATLACGAVPLRATDARLETFVAPGAAAQARDAAAPLRLARRALDSGEILAAGEAGSVLVVPFGAIGGVRGAFILKRTAAAAFSPDDVTLAARAAEATTLGLAARAHRTPHGSQERLALIGETIAALSHSIKNMLQGMRFGADAVDLALSRGDLARAQEGWPVLQRNLDRIHALALNMLAWAKERPLEPEPSDANELAREVRELLAPAAGRRRVGVLLELDDALPPASFDAPSVHQALTNLVLNAIEAAPERIGMVTISSRYDPGRDEVRLGVRDNGAGVPESVRARLFEPFVSSKGQRGTGLGLAVARKIAERHGGRLELAATSTAGTEFVFVLPASADGADPGETRTPRGIAPDEFSWKFA